MQETQEPSCYPLTLQKKIEWNRIHGLESTGLLRTVVTIQGWPLSDAGWQARFPTSIAVFTTGPASAGLGNLAAPILC